MFCECFACVWLCVWLCVCVRVRPRMCVCVKRRQDLYNITAFHSSPAAGHVRSDGPISGGHLETVPLMMMVRMWLVRMIVRMWWLECGDEDG